MVTTYQIVQVVVDIFDDLQYGFDRTEQASYQEKKGGKLG